MAQSASLKIGTRGSPLALTQAIATRSLLMAAHGLPEDAFEIVVIKTTADRIQDRALRDVGGKGLFTREIEDALLDGSIDMAVHCVKDVPVDRPAGLALGCHLVREDPRDAFVSAHWQSLWDLPEGAVVGTSSVRRRAQLLHRRPDLRIVDFRGNVGTRLKKLEDGVANATLLAMAGLNRLHMADAIGQPIATADMLPAVGQGALVIERRAGDDSLAALLAPLNDAATERQMAAERAFLAILDGSCQTPIAGLSEIVGNRIVLRGEILRLDGSEVISVSGEADIADAADLGRALAHELLAKAPDGFLSRPA